MNSPEYPQATLHVPTADPKPGEDSNGADPDSRKGSLVQLNEEQVGPETHAVETAATSPDQLTQTTLPRPILRPKVSVVVPTLNEAANLPHVLPRLPADIHELIIVDGGSADSTTDVARALCPQAQILRQPGRGKGDALACGFAAASGDVIVMIDADGSTDPEEIPRFVDALARGADLAKGSRFLQGGGSADITPLRRAGNRLLNGLVNVFYGTRYTDLCYGYNAFWATCVPIFALDCDGFEVETLMNVRAAKAGLVIVEVPSFEHERIYGESKLRTFRDGWRVLRVIFGERFRNARRDQPATVNPSLELL
jgi:glycosyltransferase involved in cell wall biosynthesis